MLLMTADASFWTNVITSIGFPIVMCGAMGWYLKYTNDNHRADVKALNEEHSEQIESLITKHETEMHAMTEAVNNNTLAINSLVEHLRMEK